MANAKRVLNKLFIDQHGVHAFAKGPGELKEMLNLTGKISKMYVNDVKTGDAIHTGWVIGEGSNSRWFTCYIPMREPA